MLHTDEPLCQDGFLACGDGNCIERGLFCNGEKDCSDGSDENTCGKLTEKQDFNKNKIYRKKKKGDFWLQSF